MGDIVKQLRDKLCLNQTEFSNKIGISRTYLSEIERGKKRLTEELASKIIDVFNLPKNFFNRSGTIEVLNVEIKIKEVNKIRAKVICDMESLGIYKKEFDSLINIYADLLFNYNRLTRLYEQIGYPVEDSFGKKPQIVNQIESTRKDIIAYSDRLMLNPKTYQISMESVEEPKSKLTKALELLG